MRDPACFPGREIHIRRSVRALSRRNARGMIMTAKRARAHKETTIREFYGFPSLSAPNGKLVFGWEEFRSNAAQLLLSVATQQKSPLRVRRLYNDRRWARHRPVISVAKLCFTWLAGVNSALFTSSAKATFIRYNRCLLARRLYSAPHFRMILLKAWTSETFSFVNSHYADRSFSSSLTTERILVIIGRRFIVNPIKRLKLDDELQKCR